MSNFQLKVWRQEQSEQQGHFEQYTVKDISADMSFLEMLDVLNEQLITDDYIPVAFDHDCREGICGACSLVIDGIPHGKECGTTTCQLYMRHFNADSVITIEPYRARAFPLIKDLIVDRGSLDRVMQSGGYVSVHTGAAADANNVLIAKHIADDAFTAATCIGCGACVAVCKNASGMLFVAAKTSQLALLPQGQSERLERSLAMVKQMQIEGFGNCSNHYECEAACPKNIPASYIAQLNRDFLNASMTSKEYESQVLCKSLEE
ncbi:MAG: succinate dehydrogenase/fumarate reductase iron-sulfur subunit, partial [Proteobacteria bacterium]|nr:succinate dehydrogenase/fumarate reductase iron-sulfur subunit [Pseudomonadota bacterium]